MQNEYDDPIANFRSARRVIEIDWHPSADVTQKSSMVARLARLVDLLPIQKKKKTLWSSH